MLKCGHDEARLVASRCHERPELLKGQPIGMYHCPDCGEMVLAGYQHPRVCLDCYRQLYGYEYGE